MTRSVLNKFSATLICILVLTCSLVVAQSNTSALNNSDEYVKIVKHYRYLKPDSALFFVKRGLELATKQKDLEGRAALLTQYGMIVDNANNFAESRGKYVEAEQIYKSIGDDVGLASVLIRLAVIEQRKGNFDKCLNLTMEAYKLSEKNNHKLGMLEGRIVMAETYFQLEKYNDALKNLNLAEAINNEIPLSNFTFNMYVCFGNTYLKLKEVDKAILYLQTGLSKVNKVEYNGLKASLLKILGLAYGQKGDLTASTSSLKAALTLSRSIDNKLREQSTLIGLADVFERKYPDSALFYLKQALGIVGKQKMYRQQIMVLNRMSVIYKNKGNLAEALRIKEESAAIADRIFYKDMMKQVVSLEAAYDLEKSKAKLHDLTIKNNTQKMQKNIILGIAITSLIVVCVILWYYLRLRELNKKIISANTELAESNDVKDKFFSIIAHDIRSPMVSTIGILRLIVDKEIDADTEALMVKKLISHCENSLNILDKLLKWGQMQIKGVRLSKISFNPTPNIRRNVDLIKASANKKNITIDVDVPSGLSIKADPDHFDFVVRNLIANAVKFTPDGGAVVLKAMKVSGAKIAFKVSDNGVGISEARIKKIFQLTAMGTKGTSAEEGTSLGLIICKEFIQANDGGIAVASTLGKGTTFTFTLNEG